MRHFVLLLALLLFAGLVRVQRLSIPGTLVFDEVYYAKAAKQYVDGQAITEEITHPPISKLLIAAAVGTLGYNAFAWRIMSVVAGTLLVLAVYLLGWELVRSTFVATFAAMLVAMDGLAFVESRIAKPDIFLVLFLVGAYLGFWRYLSTGRPGWLYLSGLAAGLAAATKWTGVASLGTIPLYLVFALGQGRWSPPSRRHWLHLALAYTLVPVAVYLLSWVPYFLNHSLSEWARFHAFMFEFHAGLKEGHPYQSQWWSWPLLVRPIWYEFEQVQPGVFRGILAIGNPVLWWAALPALIVLGAEAVRRRTPAAVFVLLGFAVSYLPYAFIGRALFLYHMLPALPFMALAVAMAAARVRDRLGQAIPLVYLAAAIGWFVAYYPVLSALPLASARFYRLMWFGTWI